MVRPARHSQVLIFNPFDYLTWHCTGVLRPSSYNLYCDPLPGGGLGLTSSGQRRKVALRVGSASGLARSFRMWGRGIRQGLDDRIVSCALGTREIDDMGTYRCPCTCECHYFVVGLAIHCPATPCPAFVALHPLSTPSFSLRCVSSVLDLLLPDPNELRKVAIPILARVTLRLPRGKRNFVI